MLLRSSHPVVHPYPAAPAPAAQGQGPVAAAPAAVAQAQPQGPVAPAPAGAAQGQGQGPAPALAAAAQEVDGNAPPPGVRMVDPRGGAGDALGARGPPRAGAARGRRRRLHGLHRRLPRGHCLPPPGSSRVFAIPVVPRPGRRGRLRASCQALVPDSPSYHHIFHRGLGHWSTGLRCSEWVGGHHHSHGRRPATVLGEPLPDLYGRHRHGFLELVHDRAVLPH